jgi:hypothetical protein
MDNDKDKEDENENDTEERDRRVQGHDTDMIVSLSKSHDRCFALTNID